MTKKKKSNGKAIGGWNHKYPPGGGGLDTARYVDGFCSLNGLTNKNRPEGEPPEFTLAPTPQED